jgi:glc operon protein GlcG
MKVIRRTVVGASTLGLVASLLTGAFARAAELSKRSVLTLEAAQRVVQAAKKEAADHSWACVIAVVDDQGLLVTEIRMDNAAVPAGVELAPGKARTAALFRRPTSALEAAINGPRPAAITAHDCVMMTGGVPIVVDGQIVGAIGVSSDTRDHDVQVANAGVAALTR